MQRTQGAGRFCRIQRATSASQNPTPPQAPPRPNPLFPPGPTAPYTRFESILTDMTPSFPGQPREGPFVLRLLGSLVLAIATLVPEPAASLPADDRNRLLRLRALESKYADDLFRFRQRAWQSDQLSLAWRFILEAVYRNPDHEQARMVLGYVKYQNTWTTQFRKQMLERGNVWNDQWGGVRKEDLPKYEADQRRAPDGQWLPADRVAASPADWT